MFSVHPCIRIFDYTGQSIQKGGLEMGLFLKQKRGRASWKDSRKSERAYVELTLWQWRRVLELFILGFSVRKISAFTGLRQNIILTVLSLTRGVMRTSRS